MGIGGLFFPRKNDFIPISEYNWRSAAAYKCESTNPFLKDRRLGIVQCPVRSEGACSHAALGLHIPEFAHY